MGDSPYASPRITSLGEIFYPWNGLLMRLMYYHRPRREEADTPTICFDARSLYGKSSPCSSTRQPFEAASRSSFFIAVQSDEASCVEVLLEGTIQLVVERIIEVGRGITTLHKGRATFLVTDFRNQPYRFTKGTAVGLIEELRDSAVIIGLSEYPNTRRTPPMELDINPNLAAPE